MIDQHVDDAFSFVGIEEGREPDGRTGDVIAGEDKLIDVVLHGLRHDTPITSAIEGAFV